MSDYYGWTADGETPDHELLGDWDRLIREGVVYALALLALLIVTGIGARVVGR